MVCIKAILTSPQTLFTGIRELPKIKPCILRRDCAKFQHLLIGVFFKIRYLKIMRCENEDSDNQHSLSPRLQIVSLSGILALLFKNYISRNFHPSCYPYADFKATILDPKQGKIVTQKNYKIGVIKNYVFKFNLKI